ncbi:DUF3081 domain-containing protein [Paraferrimonas sp. SM1919]|uniref:DUF3081 domain-containing protein n=1 Tax=Paraferrimonas sp. SM1919 TaxID=2662263 RepID=UPI0013D891B5|nr:DUF3081 domain-containing protein [Paraferrimonas sp. SM1919]
MKNEIDTSMALQAFEKVMLLGDKTEQGKIFEGLEAYTDFDGYNVYLSGNGVTLHIGFHNTYHLDYAQEHQKQSFLKKLQYVAKLATAN